MTPEDEVSEETLPGEVALMSDDVRLVAWVRGRVQGVGFRWFTRAKALEIGGLSGFALNLADGRVQVVAEGPPTGCQWLLDWLQGDDTPGQVDGVTEIWDTPRGGYDGFADR
ncbi:acylphosphatase OS=Streptomyces alboniger OX=132473 GN=CP975_25750 PE=3 SV=1 [Streptomyces alboniger]